MNCAKCGAALDSKARFCSLCGAPMQAHTANRTAGTASYSEEDGTI